MIKFLLVLYYFCLFSCKSVLVGDKKKVDKVNVVLVGAAGSGKGTQGELLRNEYGFVQVSAGEALRQYRKDPNAKYTKTINELIDSGKLVPSCMTNEIVASYVEKECDTNPKCRGVIFDGYPREIEQLKFLDEYLSKKGEKVDKVIYIDVHKEDLVERLSGRYSCGKCGEIYHKKTKPTKVAGVCDKCGSKEFVVRKDDQDIKAIENRFSIFEKQTKDVLENYRSRGLLLDVDGVKKPNEIFDDIKNGLLGIL